MGCIIDEVSPDHSTLSRFKSALTKTFEKLFSSINAQLEAHNIIVKIGIILDASVIDTPLYPKVKTNHKVSQDCTEEEVLVTKEYSDSINKNGTC